MDRAAARMQAPAGRRVGAAALATAVYAVAVLYHAFPAARSCTTRTLGPPGDGTAGMVWLAWAFERQGGLPFRSTTALTAAPGGETFWRPEWWTQSLLYLPLWLYSHVTNAVCSYNLVVLSGFMASALAMFALALWLTRHVAVSLVAGYAYAFAPFAQYKAAGHVAYVHQEAFPLILLAGLALLERPSSRRALALGLVMGAAAYLDGYYLLFSWLLVAALGGLGLLRSWWTRGRADEPGPGRLVRHLATAGLVAGLCVIPLLLAYAGGSGSAAGSVTRSPSDLDTYSADFDDYVLPARSHPWFDEVFGSWQDRHLGATNYSESTLFLGWSTILLAGVALISVLRGPTEPGGRPGSLRWRRSVPLLIGAAALLGAASGPRVWELLGVRFPGVSWFVYEVAPFWRVYARLFIPVHAAIVAAAAIGAVLVLRRLRTAPARVAMIAALALVVGVEVTASPPLAYAYFDYGTAPDGYRWLARQDDVELIADYPVWPVHAQPDGAFATFQPIHGKAVVNPKSPAGAASALNAGLLGLADDQTVPLLRHLGVDLVVVHPGLMPGSPPPAPPDGLELVRSFRFAEQEASSLTPDEARRAEPLAPWFDMDIYRITDVPTTPVVVVPGAGFSAPELSGWRASQWVDHDEARLEVAAFEPDVDLVEVRVEASSFARPRRVRFVQSGQELWSGVVPVDPVPIRFAARPGSIAIETDPGPRRIADVLPGSNDGRHVSIRLSELTARPLPSPAVTGAPAGSP